MSSRSEFPLPSELSAPDDDSALFEPAPDWIARGLAPSRHEALEEEDDGLGLRTLLARSATLPKGWRSLGRERRRERAVRSRMRSTGRSGRS